MGNVNDNWGFNKKCGLLNQEQYQLLKSKYRVTCYFCRFQLQFFCHSLSLCVPICIVVALVYLYSIFAVLVLSQAVAIVFSEAQM